jgi:iron complex outermembrane receptor protein
MPFMENTDVLRASLLATAVSAASLTVAPAWAAEDNASPMLEEIVVTAQKRAQSLQDVPISLVAMGRDELEIKGIDSLTDIGPNIPNFYVSPFNVDPTAVRLFVRGIGQNDVQITQDPSVALYLDGVYIGTSFGAGFEGVDVERMEVLRGPQGTLYGRNATGGAVNIITQRANVSEWMMRQDFTVGDLGKFQSKTMVNVPIADRFALKLNYLHSDRDGNIDNKGAGHDFGEEERRSAVVDLRWESTENLTFDYRYEDARLKDTQRLDQVRKEGDCPTCLLSLAPNTVFSSPPSRGRVDKIRSDRPINNNDQTVKAHTLAVDWSINSVLSMKSITAWRNVDGITYNDSLVTATGDYRPFGDVGAPAVAVFDTDFTQKSQELQLLGSTENWEFVPGRYYYEDEADQDATKSELIGVVGDTDLTSTENTSAAVFAQATWTPEWMSRRWHFTLGGRYSEDTRKAKRDNQAALSPFTGSYDEDFSNFNPSLTIGFDLTDYSNIYAKAVSGYKSGGTSTRSANAVLFEKGFEEEDIVSYELGFKGEFWGRRGRLNAAIFNMDIDGLQTSVQTDPVSPGGRDFLPIDDNSISGFEADINLLLTEGLTLNVGYGYLDTELGSDTVTTPDGRTYELIDGMALAPENSYTLALDYQLPVANGVWGVNVNYGYQDEVDTSINVQENIAIDSYGLLGATISWSDVVFENTPGSFRMLLWGKNLTDEDYGIVRTISWSTFGATDVQTYGDPRTVGVTLSYSY